MFEAKLNPAIAVAQEQLSQVNYNSGKYGQHPLRSIGLRDVIDTKRLDGSYLDAFTI